MSYTTLVPKPSADSVNTGLSALNTRELIRVLGHPRLQRDYTSDCQPITNPDIKRHIVTASVGPFRVTGYDKVIPIYAAMFADVKADHPDLYALLGSAGMLCCRQVRGSDALSNHAFGLALDLTIGGQLDRRGDNMVQSGLLVLYSYFRRHGLYWGVEFHTEDAMHIEIALETFMKLRG